MTTSVVKADGRRQPFMREKLLRSARRMGATNDVAEKAVQKVEAQIYDGINSGELIRLLQKALRQFPSLAQYGSNLREALARMVSYPDFEVFVRRLLSHVGYSVKEGRILTGRCGKHEIDGILHRNNETLILEVKHHRRFHTRTGLDEVRIARAALEDFQEGFTDKITPVRVTGIVIVTNTKLSVRAAQYARCRNIQFIGWATPRNNSLNRLTSLHRFYPVTFLRGLQNKEHQLFSRAKIYTLTDLLAQPPSKLSQATGLATHRLGVLIDRAQKILKFKTPTN